MTVREKLNPIFSKPIEEFFDRPEQANECVIPECQGEVVARQILVDRRDTVIVRNFCLRHAESIQDWQEIWYTVMTPPGWGIELGAAKEGKEIEEGEEENKEDAI